MSRLITWQRLGIKSLSLSGKLQIPILLKKNKINVTTNQFTKSHLDAFVKHALNERLDELPLLARY